MNVKIQSILEHMLADATDAMQFAEAVGDIAAFSSNKLYRKNLNHQTKKYPGEKLQA